MKTYRITLTLLAAALLLAATSAATVFAHYAHDGTRWAETATSRSAAPVENLLLPPSSCEVPEGAVAPDRKPQGRQA